jgi:uncharacterized protein
MKTPNKAKLDRIQRDADRGVALAQMTLGYIYLTGKGLTRDYDKAFEWYKKAAEQGNVMAQSRLGVLYWNGNGVAKDRSMASAWLSIASAAGYRHWSHRLTSFLAKHYLTREEHQKAQYFVTDWQKMRTKLVDDKPASSSLLR